ncbi:amidase [Leucobacter sp. wl10]|uniref:amidase n=1 Tax=Leucobacter sp. wl10 TaxID=2304677 RepID=UPI000E5B6B08|nr:amidase [Leucobacter sp. wl10]RGE18948.1 amidase [Leucobacter sp. wl10]
MSTSPEICYLTATEARRLFAARELSPVELLEALISRSEETEPVVNALCHLDFERAMDAARESERRYLGAGDGPVRDLEGIPVAIKEDLPITGQPWTQGSLTLKDHVADHTSVMGQRIIDAGAVVHARTTSAEFGAAPFTRSKLWGVTRNPWNPAFAAGGSSGGSAAALASGVTTLATGSDVAGSIRIPASFTGTIGYKPPRGRVPIAPPWNLDTFMHLGPLARTVEDAILLQNVIAGPSTEDFTSVKPKYVLPEAPRSVEGLRVAISEDLGSYAVDPEIRANIRAVAEVLRAGGATVEFPEVVVERETVLRAFAAHILRDGDGTPPGSELLSPYIPVNWRRKTELLRGGPYDHDDLIAEISAPFRRVFDDYDLFICPTVTTRGFDADSDYLGDTELRIEGQTFVDPDAGLMTMLWNAIGSVPVLSAPSGFADNGVPTGVQLVGAPYEDETVFRAAAVLQRSVRLFPSGSVPQLGIQAPARSAQEQGE